MGTPPRDQVSLRVVEDHHVDRPGVEAWQHVKLTGTNNSIGLIFFVAKTNSEKSIACSGKALQRTTKPKTDTLHSIPSTKTRYENQHHRPQSHEQAPGSGPAPLPDPSIDGLVATARGEPPDPIPNSAVKTLRADGTAS